MILYNKAKQVTRISNISKYNVHTEPLFKKLKLLKVEDILKLQQLKCYLKYRNNMLPWYLSSQNENHTSKFYLKLNKNIHDHNSRSSNKLHKTNLNHSYAKKCLRHNIVITINNTSDITLL